MDNSKKNIPTPELIILRVDIKYEDDIVLVRQRSRQTAKMLGFNNQDQTRIATATSEIARNAYLYAGGGTAEFAVAGKRPHQIFLIRIRDEGPGIKDIYSLMTQNYISKTGLGLGIIGASRLMEYFDIESIPDQGTIVLLGKLIPYQNRDNDYLDMELITNELANLASQSALNEVQIQNQELLSIMQDLVKLNGELKDTNRGVMALYAELEDRAEQLKRALEVKSRFFSYLGHEMRTPVSSIQSIAGILLDRLDGELTTEQDKQVHYIYKAATDLMEIINDLLDLSRVEAKKILINPNQFEVSELFGSLRGIMKPLNIKPAVKLIFEEPKDIPTLYNDETKVAQILRNLISNALKFTEHGEVRVSARMIADAEVVEFSISDTGIGIALKNQEHIFNEFYQIDSSLQKEVKGTGLGLALSKKLALALNGDLLLESELGVGSTFTVMIPLVYVEDRPSSNLGAQQILDQVKYPVLVVEDDPNDLALFEKYLEGSCFQVISASTLKEARNVLKKIRPITVMLDILLLGEDGWSLLTEMKRDESTREIPVLITTIIDDQQEKALELGADEYFVKPVNHQKLLEKLFTLRALEKILIIDDQPIDRYALKRKFLETGCTIVEAENGVEGIRKAKEEHPQVIFLDLVMPEMNGFEVLDHLNDDISTRDIPVIIYTNKVLKVEERHQLLNNSQTILSKGTISRDEIIMYLNKAILRVRARRDSE
jgi:signal transduction histidine kinase/CheY-like chemotaxis protein